jgi:hypothetical protein
MRRCCRTRRSSSRPKNKIRRVVLCSGKVYYDLYEEREKRGINDIYLLRIEQLYPVPMKALVQELSASRSAEMVWCQEEPRNMGAWHFIEPYLEWVLNADQRHAQASALCGPRSLGGDRDRPDVEASRSSRRSWTRRSAKALKLRRHARIYSGIHAFNFISWPGR